ncbi:MAG: hypothetical protein Q8Q32_02515, partial [bacterium]|nr:hypothetical protein [bacterium]
MQTKTNAKERYDLLPEAIRDWLGSFEATNHITNINDSYKVSWEKRRVIPRNIARLAIGMVKPEAFQSTIKAELGVSDPIAAQITTKIAQKILVPVADALKTTQNIDLSPLMKMAATKPQTGQSQLRPISLDSLAKQGQTLSSASQTEESTTKKPMSAFASIKQGSLAHESQKQQAEQKSAPQTDTVQEVPELDQPENFQPIDS